MCACVCMCMCVCLGVLGFSLAPCKGTAVPNGGEELQHVLAVGLELDFVIFEAKVRDISPTFTYLTGTEF